MRFGVIYHSGVELYKSELIPMGMVDNSEDFEIRVQGGRLFLFLLGSSLGGLFRNCGYVDGVE